MTDKNVKPENRSKNKKELTPFKVFLRLLGVTLGVELIIFIIAAMSVAFSNSNCHGSNFCTTSLRFFIGFKHPRSAFFLSFITLIIVQSILALFWKPARKIGLFIFYFVAGAVIAVTGQVVDYVTRSDIGGQIVNTHGGTFGDYGVVSECGYGGCGYNSKENETKQTEPIPSTPSANATSNLINDFNYCQADNHH